MQSSKREKPYTYQNRYILKKYFSCIVKCDFLFSIIKNQSTVFQFCCQYLNYQKQSQTTVALILSYVDDDHHHKYSAHGQVLHCKLRHQGCNCAQMQVFHCKLRTQVAVLLGMNRCGSFPLLSAPHSLFTIRTNLKRSEKIPGAPTRR